MVRGNSLKMPRPVLLLALVALGLLHIPTHAEARPPLESPPSAPSIRSDVARMTHRNAAVGAAAHRIRKSHVKKVEGRTPTVGGSDVDEDTPLPVSTIPAGSSSRMERKDSQNEGISSDSSEADRGEAPYMHVVKRDGRREPVAFDKITKRLRSLCKGLNTDYVDPGRVAQKVVQGMYNGVSTAELDNLAAETAAYLNIDHPDYARLAARVSVSNLHKETNPSFSQTMRQLYDHVDPATGHAAGFISEEVMALVAAHGPTLDAAVRHERDYFFDYFGFKTMERAYLLKIGRKVVERPQYMLMRVALGIHGQDLPAALETYELMSNKWFIHASPTLFHAGTRFPQMSSCFLLAMQADSIVGIYDTLKQCAVISKAAGGIGLSAHNIRAHGAYIKGTKGTSNGLVPMLRVFDVTARYVDQGGGKRPGAFAIYLEPWHADIFEVLDLRKNHGKEEARARDLFYGLWIPDLFMERVEEDGTWSLMCPDQCPGLADCHGQAFRDLYLKYERQGRVKKTVRAQDLWFAILDSQIETGTPYMLYKDACNLKSNQQNLGTIKSSNLCTEIVQYTSPEEVAVCNLASVVLPKFVVQGAGTGGKDNGQAADLTAQRGKGPGSKSRQELTFDHQALYNVTKVVVRNLNKVIDRNLYPVPEAERSNRRHRPIGLGVQGLADAFIKLRLPFDSPEARQTNKEIFETMYFAACEASMELAKKEGPYESYPGSPASQGKLQFDLWGVTPESGRWDWAGLKKEIAKHGLRNSLLLAPMPTASTAQILGYNECIEPYTSNLYARRVKAGEFIVVNPHLLEDLTAQGLWTPAVRNALVAEGGSVQNIPGLPQEMKEIYRTVWEIKQKSLIDMAADRGAYIDQSQSLNAFMAEPDYSRLVRGLGEIESWGETCELYSR